MAPLKTFSDIINELSMKSDKKLPNLKTPVKGKKGTSKFMRMKIHNAPYTSDYKKAMNAGFKTDANRKAAFAKMNDAVQSADRKPEKYIKPDGKVGIRMVKTDKEVIKKESSFGDNSFAARLIKIRNHPKVKAARKAHAAGTWDGNVNKEGEAVVHINGKPHVVTNKSKTKNLRKEAIDFDRMRFQAAASQKKNQKKTDDKEKKSMAAKADMDMRARNEMIDPMDLRGRPKKKDPNPESPYGMKHPLHPANIAKKKAKEAEKVKKEAKTFNYFDNNDDAQAHAKKHGGKVYVNTGKGNTKVKGKRINTHVVIKKEEVEVDEALNLQQRMKRSRLMKRMKSRIKIGRQRAMRKMANKKTIEKRAMRQARNQLAKKLTRGIPKKELTFARKQEIEKRLAKPALQSRIKRIAKRIFKDVRKAEVERKKG